MQKSVFSGCAVLLDNKEIELGSSDQEASPSAGNIERHLNESKVHLNRSGTIEFAENVCEFFLQYDSYSADNSDDLSLVTLAINLPRKSQFLKSHTKFQQI